MSATRDTGFLRNVIQVHDTGVRIMSGSTMLMAISSSGAVTTTGTISGSNVESASFSLNSNLLQGTGSVGFTTTASFTTLSSSFQQVSSSQQQVSASYTALSSSYNTFSGSASTRITVDSASLLQVSSSQQQISSSLLQVSASYTALSGSYNTYSSSVSTRTTQIEQVYATTGSNSFRATQSITGSLTVTGQITAQTLNVQQVTSSIVYSSGSNVFGCDLNSRQTFTGSVLITGSLTIAGASSATSYSGTTIYGSTAVCSPSILSSGTICATGNTCFGGMSIVSSCLGIGTTSPANTLHVAGVGRMDTGLYFNNSGTGGAFVWNIANESLRFGTNDTERMRITSGGIACFACQICAPQATLGCLGIGQAWTTAGGTYQTLQAKGIASCDVAWFEGAGGNDVGVYIGITGCDGRIGTSYRSAMTYGGLRLETSGQTRVTINTAGLALFNCTVCAPKFWSTGDVNAAGTANAKYFRDYYIGNVYSTFAQHVGVSPGSYQAFCASQGAILYITSMHNNGRSTTIISYTNGITGGMAYTVINQTSAYSPANVTFTAGGNGWLCINYPYGGPTDFMAQVMGGTHTWGSSLTS